MTIEDKNRFKKQLVATYDQLIESADDLILRQYFIEERLKIEQRVNDFWLRKVLLSNPMFLLLIAPHATKQVVFTLPMTSATEEQAKMEVGAAIMSLASEYGVHLYDGEYNAIVVRKSLYNNERAVTDITNDEGACVTSKAFAVKEGSIKW